MCSPTNSSPLGRPARCSSPFCSRRTRYSVTKRTCTPLCTSCPQAMSSSSQGVTLSCWTRIPVTPNPLLFSFLVPDLHGVICKGCESQRLSHGHRSICHFVRLRIRRGVIAIAQNLPKTLVVKNGVCMQRSQYPSSLTTPKDVILAANLFQLDSWSMSVSAFYFVIQSLGDHLFHMVEKCF